MKNLSGLTGLLPGTLFENKDQYDEVLYQLFMLIIQSGSMCYTMAARYEEGLNASNYLKKDKNYYSILEFQWQNLKAGIYQIFDALP